MTVTELALLRFLPGVALDNSLLEDLKLAKVSMEEFTGYSFRYYNQIEDPSLFYIIGEWDSANQHIERWIPSKENQRLMELLKDRLEVVWMYHLDVQPRALPLEAPVISLTRHFMSAAKKESFQQAFGEGKTILESLTSPRTAGGGWRIEKEAKDKEEWVLFSGWDSVEDHVKFNAWYARIQDNLDGIEMQHLRKVET